MKYFQHRKVAKEITVHEQNMGDIAILLLLLCDRTNHIVPSEKGMRSPGLLFQAC